MSFEKITGGVTSAKGYQAAAVAAGIKKRNSTKKDLAIVYSNQPAAVAGVFTQNKFAAAPVEWCRKMIAGGKAQAVVFNSGNANACTGVAGYEDAVKMAAMVAQALHIDENQVGVASTGVIGHRLPMDVIAEGVPKAVAALKADGGHEAAEAIMTTDTFCKESAVTVQIGGKTVTLGGMSKGSGMIYPNMATTLSLVTTDAAISAKALQKALSAAIEDSFNMVSVDGDTSTNDTFLVMANGMAENAEIQEDSVEFAEFSAALREVSLELAMQIAKDGEGATRLFSAEVINARDKQNAIKAAKAVVSSNLVKAAIFGEDANWGRIICAIGYSGAELVPEKVDMWVESKAGSEQMMKDGAGLAFDEEKAKTILQEKEIKILIDLKDGNAKTTAYGCDLTYDYIKINADYRS